MKVICEYCGSYVEADENAKCPSCLAELGSAVQTVQEQTEAQNEAERQREADQQAQEAKDEHLSEIIKGVASVATAFVAGRATASASSSQFDGDRPPLPPDHDRHEGGMSRHGSHEHGGVPTGHARIDGPGGDMHARTAGHPGGPGGGPGRHH